MQILTKNLLRSKMKWKTCKPKKNNVVTYVGFDRNIRNMKIQADTQKVRRRQSLESEVVTYEIYFRRSIRSRP